MTGRLVWREADAPRSRHLRVLLRLDDGHELHFEDQRKFGRLYLAGTPADLATRLGRLGPEPLNDDFTIARLASLLRGRTAVVKAVLLDQRRIAGLGNIYVDEALHRAGIHPSTRAHTLEAGEIERLHAGIVASLRQGIANRGTTISAFRDAWGRAGLNRERLLVFRRQGQACARCGTPIVKTRVAGRGTHICPSCQPLHGAMVAAGSHPAEAG
jgi:formamidopyrimidine-DNA glycosylase